MGDSGLDTGMKMRTSGSRSMVAKYVDNDDYCPNYPPGLKMIVLFLRWDIVSSRIEWLQNILCHRPGLHDC